MTCYSATYPSPRSKDNTGDQLELRALYGMACALSHLLFAADSDEYGTIILCHHLLHPVPPIATSSPTHISRIIKMYHRHVRILLLTLPFTLAVRANPMRSLLPPLLIPFSLLPSPLFALN